MASDLGNYAIAFALTITLELAVAWLLGYRRGAEIAAVVFVSVFTHPLANYLVWIAMRFREAPVGQFYIVLLEVAIVLVEWGLLAYALPRREKGRLFLLSLAMNAVSYGAGLVFPWWLD
jgi:hypothetical protein